MQKYFFLIFSLLYLLPLNSVFVIGPDFLQQLARKQEAPPIPVPVMLGGKVEHITASVACIVCSCVFQHFALHWFKKKGWIKKNREIDWRSLITTKLLQAAVNYYLNFVAPPEPINAQRQQWLLWAYGAEPPSPLLEFIVRGTTLAWFAVRALAELYAYTHKNPRSFLLSRPWETKRYILSDLLIFVPIGLLSSLIHECGHWFCAEIIAPETEPWIVSLGETKFERYPPERWQGIAISAAGGLVGGTASLVSFVFFDYLSRTLCKKPEKNSPHTQTWFQKNKKIFQELVHFVVKKIASSSLYFAVIHGDDVFSPSSFWLIQQPYAFFYHDGGIIYNLLRIKPSPLFGF